ncbi:unnamed protein product, partial [Iphiclides podalirius]
MLERSAISPSLLHTCRNASVRSASATELWNVISDYVAHTARSINTPRRTAVTSFIKEYKVKLVPIICTDNLIRAYQRPLVNIGLWGTTHCHEARATSVHRLPYNNMGKSTAAAGNRNVLESTDIESIYKRRRDDVEAAPDLVVIVC